MIILYLLLRERPRLRALAEEIGKRGGAGWRDPAAPAKFRAEVGEFRAALATGDRAEAATELADLLWYAAKITGWQRVRAVRHISWACRELNVSPQQAVACCLAKYSYRASRERGKGPEHRSRERELCAQAIGERA